MKKFLDSCFALSMVRWIPDLPACVALLVGCWIPVSSSQLARSISGWTEFPDPPGEKSFSCRITEFLVLPANDTTEFRKYRIPGHSRPGFHTVSRRRIPDHSGRSARLHTDGRGFLKNSLAPQNPWFSRQWSRPRSASHRIPGVSQLVT